MCASPSLTSRRSKLSWRNIPPRRCERVGRALRGPSHEPERISSGSVFPYGRRSRASLVGLYALRFTRRRAERPRTRFEKNGGCEVCPRNGSSPYRCLTKSQCEATTHGRIKFPLASRSYIETRSNREPGGGIHRACRTITLGLLLQGVLMDSAKTAIGSDCGDLQRRSVLLDHAAELLGVSRRTVYYRIREGRLTTIRTRSGSQRVLLDSLEALLWSMHLQSMARRGM